MNKATGTKKPKPKQTRKKAATVTSSRDAFLKYLNKALKDGKIGEKILTLPEIFKLMQMKEELTDKGPLKVTVQWIDNWNEMSDET